MRYFDSCKRGGSILRLLGLMVGICVLGSPTPSNASASYGEWSGPGERERAEPSTPSHPAPPPLCLGTTTAEITPCGDDVITRQSVSRSVTFRVTETSSSGGEYNFSCDVVSPVTSCSPTQSTAQLSWSGSYLDVTVNYTTGANTGTGQVSLIATSLMDYGTATGRYDIIVHDSTRLAPGVQLVGNEALRDLGLCAVSCFEATASVSTPAYISLDAPRSITLAYVGRQAQQFATIQLDVADLSATRADTLALAILDANGNPVALENGDTTLFFLTGAGNQRVAARFSTVGLQTGAHRFSARVTSAWNGNALKRTTTLPVRVLVINESGSPYGYGWSVAGLPRIQANAAGDTLAMTDGAGSIAYYRPWSFCVPGCEYSEPWGDFSTLSRTGISDAGIRWERRFLDGGKISFDSIGRARYLTDRFGNRVTYFWRDSLRLDSIQDPIGKSIRFAYDASNKLRAIRDPGGRITHFTVNTSGDLVSMVDSATSLTVASFAYDSTHRLVDRFDAAGAKFTYTYDHTGLVATDSMPTIVANGNTVRPTIRLGSLESARVPTVASGLGSRSNPGPHLDPDTLQATVLDPEGNVSRLKLDGLGQATRVIGPVGDTTRFTLVHRRVYGITYPWGAGDSFEYDDKGRLIAVRTAAGDTTYFRYGANSQVDSIWGPRPPGVWKWLGSNGRVDSTRVAGQFKTRYLYDSRGRVTQVKDHENHTTKYFYSASNGNLDSTHAEGNRFTKLGFDSHGRTETVLAKGLSRVWTQYDGFNRVTRTWTEGHSPADTIKFFHGPVFTDSIVDGKGQRYRSTLNALGWATQEFDPDTARGSMSYTYDRNGRVKTWTNRRGGVMNYAYDSAGRIKARWETGAAPDSFSYSADSRRVTGWNAVSRDEIFRARDLWTDSVVTRFAVDTTRRFVIRYRKDQLGRIDSVQALNPGGSIEFATRRYTYDPYTGRLIQLLIGGKRMRFKYNSEGLADSVLFDSVGVKRWMKYTSTHQPYEVNFSPAGHSSAFQRRYGIDSLYRIQELAQRSGSGWEIERYRYDGKSQLSGRAVTLGLSSHCGNRTDPYGYDCQPAPATAIIHDAVGNTLYDTTDDSLATEYAFDYATGNRVKLREHLRKVLPSEWGYTHYTHDRDGNRDSLKAHTGTITTYGWSADSKLHTVAKGATTLAYGYNAFGQLVQRKRNGTPERHLLWNGDNLFAELNGSLATRIAEYVYHGIDAPAALITGDTAITKVRYFEQDQIGNVVGVFGSSVDQTYEYSYRGTIESSTGALADTNRVRFKGAIFEGDIAGLYYMRNRWYDPNTGHFLSKDPIGLAGGINGYAFSSDPINQSDPFGLDNVSIPNRNGTHKVSCEDTGYEFGWEGTVSTPSPGVTRVSTTSQWSCDFERDWADNARGNTPALEHGSIGMERGAGIARIRSPSDDSGETEGEKVLHCMSEELTKAAGDVIAVGAGTTLVSGLIGFGTGCYQGLLAGAVAGPVGMVVACSGLGLTYGYIAGQSAWATATTVTAVTAVVTTAYTYTKCTSAGGP